MLAIQIHYVQGPQEQSPTILLSVNIVYISFLGRILVVHAASILQRQDVTSFTSMVDSMNIGIQEEIQQPISSCFWILIRVHLSFASHHLVSQVQITLLETCFSGFFSLFFFLFSFSFTCSFSCYVCSYKVATTVCLCTLCNKLLKKKKKKDNEYLFLTVTSFSCLQSCTSHKKLSFFFIKKNETAQGDFEGWILSVFRCSLRNLLSFCCSLANSGYILQFLNGASEIISIAWSQHLYRRSSLNVFLSKIVS